MFAVVAASAAWQPLAVPLTVPLARTSSSVSMMARWLDTDLKRRSKPVPAEVDSLLAADFPSRPQVGIMWAALRECYATDDDAIAAAKRYPSLVLPYMNSPSNIAGCYSVLVDLLGREGARGVCIQNPAVLGNDPSSLQRCTAKDIQDSADLREFIDLRLPFGLRFWAGAFAAAAVAGIAAALSAPASAASVAPDETTRVRPEVRQRARPPAMLHSADDVQLASALVLPLLAYKTAAILQRQQLMWYLDASIAIATIALVLYNAST